ncbi:hypothetical protein, partial [Streptomyces sp. NPDC088358]|uniref:hypothetical protein n=1 Tax=Streptomyces sp. NPDC088358 TaxID=3365857 RepID=UPI003830DDC5
MCTAYVHAVAARDEWVFVTGGPWSPPVWHTRVLLLRASGGSPGWVVASWEEASSAWEGSRSAP